jgi:aspartate/methionine/tyrosine aminotransferase
MVRARSAYMEWAKSRPRPRIDLAGSNLEACTLDDLRGAREALDLAGSSPDGYPPLLDAIAARYGVTPDRVATAVGCTGANFLAAAAVLDAGDDVLVERPNYDALVATVEMLGARPRFFDRRAEDGFALHPEVVDRAATHGTRLVIVSNPHNPSGVLAPPGAIEALGRLAERSGFVVIVDEVYRDTVFEKRPPCAATLSPALISTNSLTKSYGLASLRCGWTLASAELTEKIRRARDVVDVSGPLPAERLATLAFSQIDRLADRARRIVESNRPVLREMLGAHPELSTADPAATLAFPRFRDGRDAGPFVRDLFEHDGVAVVPGEFFGMPSHFRVSSGGPPKAFREGLDALSRRLRIRP